MSVEGCEVGDISFCGFEALGGHGGFGCCPCTAAGECWEEKVVGLDRRHDQGRASKSEREGGCLYILSGLPSTGDGRRWTKMDGRTVRTCSAKSE
jgi:hypothetical protein